MTALERGEKLAELEAIHDRSIRREAAVERLEALLVDEDEAIRAQAAGAAARFPGEDALVARLLDIARDDADGAVRTAAVTALGSVFREGVLFRVDREEVDDLDLEVPSRAQFEATRDILRRLSRRMAGPLKARALEGFAYLHDDPMAIEAIEAMAEAEDEKSRITALTCMGRSGSARWADRIAAVLEEGGSDRLVEQAVWAAGACEARDLAGLVGRILRSGGQATPVRVAAAGALACLGRDQAPVLLEVAEAADEEDEVRGAARRALEVIDLSAG